MENRINLKGEDLLKIPVKYLRDPFGIAVNVSDVTAVTDGLGITISQCGGMGEIIKDLRKYHKNKMIPTFINEAYKKVFDLDSLNDFLYLCRDNNLHEYHTHEEVPQYLVEEFMDIPAGGVVYDAEKERSSTGSIQAMHYGGVTLYFKNTPAK